MTNLYRVVLAIGGFQICRNNWVHKISQYLIFLSNATLKSNQHCLHDIEPKKPSTESGGSTHRRRDTVFVCM